MPIAFEETFKVEIKPAYFRRCSCIIDHTFQFTSLRFCTFINTRHQNMPGQSWAHINKRKYGNRSGNLRNFIFRARKFLIPFEVFCLNTTVNSMECDRNIAEVKCKLFRCFLFKGRSMSCFKSIFQII